MQGYETLRVAAGPATIRVFMRGMGRAPTDLDRFARVVAGAGYRMVLPEPRGIGESSGPLDGITFHDLAKDVAAVIERVGGAPVAMVGHAFGNRIARTLAADRPDLVALVVLLSCSGKVPPPADVAAAIKVAQSMHLPAKERLDAIRKCWFGPGRDITPWVDGWSVPVIQASLKAAEATPLADFWTAGKAPILIVQGLADASVPPENGRLLKADVGDRATLVELPGIGHALPVEAPEEVAAPVLEFLAQRFDVRPASRA
jgi:pimeloyl-ACP methyl ester carboxylesterase